MVIAIEIWCVRPLQQTEGEVSYVDGCADELMDG